MNRTRCFLAASLLAMSFYPTAAFGASITTHETEMDAVFSQGALDIDIRFNAPVTVVAPGTLLDIDNASELSILFGLFAVPANTVSMYFVDQINWCGFSASFHGCAEVTGDDIIIASWAAATGTGFGGELEAHELGHNFGLEHPDPPTGNLMDPTINGNSTLTAAQIATIQANGAGIIQNDIGGDFVSITPILVTVPESSTGLLLGLGLLGVAIRRRV